MYCKKCGTELHGERYCPVCGTEQVENVSNDPFTTTTTAEVGGKQPAKVWSIFATVGKVLGIVSIATCWIPFLIGLVAGVPGIVFSCLGKKAQNDLALSKCRTGLKLSIAGLVISIFTYIMLFIIAAAMGVALGDYFYNYY